MAEVFVVLFGVALSWLMQYSWLWREAESGRPLFCEKLPPSASPASCGKGEFSRGIYKAEDKAQVARIADGRSPSRM